jgi:hypothetical protein
MSKPDEYTLTALQVRATERAEDLGHHLGQWMSAKRKHGPGSMRVLCRTCGMMVMIMPRHQHGKGIVPAMKGEALFDKCVAYRSQVM